MSTRRCDRCNIPHCTDNLAETWDGKLVCLECRIEYYGTCSGCGCEVHHTKLSEDNYCPNCAKK